MRDKLFTMRMTEVERAELNELATAKGVSAADYVRLLIRREGERRDQRRKGRQRS